LRKESQKEINDDHRGKVEDFQQQKKPL